MNSGRDDDADPERGETDDDRQRGILFFHQLPPKMEGRDLVDETKATTKIATPRKRVEDGVGEDCQVIGCYL